MRGLSRQLAALVGVIVSLPAWASAVVILVTPPVAAWMPPAVGDLLRPAAVVVFAAIARLPPDSLAGQLFYGSFAPLPGLVGDAALALHAALLGLPWLGLAALVFRHFARPAGTRDSPWSEAPSQAF